MKPQRLYNGVRFLGGGPCLKNVAKLDAGARPMVLAMMARGLQVDLAHFASMEKVLSDDMDRITEEVKTLTGTYVNLDSGDQVSTLLFKQLGLKQARRKFTKSGDRESVENEVLVAIQHDHPVVPKLLEFKELSKLRGTYVVPMPRLAQRTAHGQWRMFPKLGDTRVPSSRLNCKEPNLLAMPNRTPRGRQICEGFITDDGWTFLSIDESQIEPRVVAHRSGDPELRRIYFNEEDIYSDFAISAFRLDDQRYQDGDGWHYPGVDKKLHRFPSKTCILAAIYDVTNVGLLEQMPTVCRRCGKESKVHTAECPKFESHWNEDNCQDILNAFYLKYPKILSMRKEDHRRAKRYGYLWDDWGRILHVTAVRSVHQWVVSSALREAGNFPIQCLHKSSRVIKKGVGSVEIGSLVGQNAELWDGTQWADGSIVSSGPKTQMRITSKDGKSLVCSPDHRLLLVTSKGIERWARAEELKTLDTRNIRLKTPSGISEDWHWGVTIPDCPAKTRISENTYDLTWVNNNYERFGEFLGRIASDGCLTNGAPSRGGAPKCVRLLVAEHEMAIQPKLMETAQMIGRVCQSTIKKPGYAPLYTIDIYSTTLTRLFAGWGLKQRIPDVVWRNSQLLRGYLRGMFDGDGTVAPDNIILTFGGSNGRLPLAKDIQLALCLLGIRSRLRVYKTSIRLAIQKRDTWLFRQLIGFLNPKKMDRILEMRPLTKSIPVYGKATAVRSVETLEGQAEMVDFVNSSTSKFMAEGLVVHNSTAQGTVKLTMAAVHDDMVIGKMFDVAHPLLQIHDELLFECREDMAEELAAHVSYRFETSVKLDVPIKASSAQAKTWGSLPK